MIDFKVAAEKLQMMRGFCALPYGYFGRPIKGIRTNCVTGVETEVDLKYEIRYSPDGIRRSFWIIGGPTGYESFGLDSFFETTVKKYILDGGWSACSGTKMRWDKLFIPPDEMRRVFEQEGLI